MRILSALLYFGVCAAFAAPASAQRAIAAAGEVDASRLPAPLLTLRPAEGLEALAAEVAGVLELRSGRRVALGSAPPPQVLEAVPAGHVALALRDGALLLVLGAPGGRAVETVVHLLAEDLPARARAVALGVEALRDEAMDLSRAPPVPAAPSVAGEVDPAPAPPERGSAFTPGGPTALADREAGGGGASQDLLTAVRPLLYVRAFAGSSTASAGLMSGLGAGLGLCVRGHCLLLGAELPSYLGAVGRMDARYRYPTFLSGFYSRPFSFGAFTPGATLGFFTRIGEFGEDMGLGKGGLETDLGARGSLELSWELVDGLDLMAEAGVDLTIDRLQLASENSLTNRVDRWSPWAQTALRFRP